MDATSDSKANTAENINDYKTLFVNASTQGKRSVFFLEALTKKLSKVLSAVADDFDNQP